MRENTELFLQKLKICSYNHLNEFANKFNPEKHELILKIKNAEPLSKDEWDLALGKYEHDIHVAKALLIMPHISDIIKNDIVHTYVRARLASKHFGYDNGMVKTILENNTFISDFALDLLYTNCNAIVMNLLRDSNEDMNLLPKNTIHRLITFELETLNEKRTKPSSYQISTFCFSQVRDETMLNFVLENMPSNFKISETIATQLINCQYISDNKKNEIFDRFGCHGELLKSITPEIANALYLSAIETAYPDAYNPSPSYFESSNIEKARYFIEHLLYEKLLPEAEELDLVNRVISDTHMLKDKKMNEMIKYVIDNTKNPSVLHAIFKSDLHANDRNNVFKNPNVSKEDVREQAKIYCDKIRHQFKQGNRTNISDKWFRILDSMMNKAVLNNDEYYTILDTKSPLLLDRIITCKHTPQPIFEKAVKIIDEERSEKQTRGWDMLKLKATMNKTLEKYGFEDAIYLKVATDTLENMISYHAIYNEFVSTCISSKFFTNTPELAEKMPDILIDVIKEIDYVAPNFTQEEYCERIKAFFEKESKKYAIEENMSIGEINFYQLLRATDEQINKFSKLVLENEPYAYFELDNIADAYAEIDKEFKNRTIPTREER